MVVAVYPGSFDPVTNGHLDILERALKIFERVIIAVAQESKKTFEFTLDERLRFIEESVKGYENVEVESFSGLLVKYLDERNAAVIIRGLREISDFEREYQMAVMNRKLAPGIETVFLSTGSEYYFVSSSLIVEVAGLGGDVSSLVPECVSRALRERKSWRTDAGDSGKSALGG